MKKASKWIWLLPFSLLAVLVIPEVTKSPEQKQAEQASREQMKAQQALEEKAKRGLQALDEAYVMDVKPVDAKFTNCSYGLVDSRHIVRCGISYGSTQLAHVGYWEVEPKDGGFIAHAMNGKALAALDRITRAGSHSSTNYPGAFKSGAGRSPLDIAQVNETIK